MEKEVGSSRQNAKGGGADGEVVGGAGVGSRCCCRPAELPEAGMELGRSGTEEA
jgi:hypothetical protein